MKQNHIAVGQENPFQMCLDSPTMFNKVKNTNVNKIGKTILIICRVVKTVIFGMYMVLTEFMADPPSQMKFWLKSNTFANLSLFIE